MANPIRSRLLACGLIALQFVFAHAFICAGDLKTWESHCKELAKDPSVVRLYTFDKEGDNVRNMAQKGAGTLLIGAKEPYREYSGETKDQEFPIWTSGLFPGKPSLCFKSAKDSVARSQFYNTGTDSMSVELWIRTHLNPGDKSQSILLSVGSGFGSGWCLGSTFYNVGFRFGRSKEEGGDVDISIPKALEGHVWHHLVVEAGKGVLKIYIDGELAGGKSFEGNFTQPPAPGGHFAQCPEEDRGGLKIGNIRDPVNSLYFDCDELAIYGRELSAAEVKKNYEAGKPSSSLEEQKKEHLSLLGAQDLSSKISLELPREYYGYFPHGQKFPLSVKIPESIAASLNGPLSIEAEMTDINDKYILKAKGAIEKGGSSASMDMAIPETCGLYWITARVKDSTGAILKARIFPIASCVPVAPMSERPSSSPVAAHGGFNIWPEAIALGARCERDISVWRPKKEDGTYDWRYPDMYVDECLKSGMDMMYCEQAHSFDKAALDKVANGDDSEWVAWLRPLIERYKGRVKYWEVCNEPNARGCTPEQYVALLKSAHKIIRELDPGSKIVGLCGVSDYPQWTEDVLSKGGGKYFDILAFHNYIGGSPISEWRKLHKIERVKGSMEKHLGKILPIWNTESGIHQNWRVNGKPLNDDELLSLYPRGRKVDGLTLVPADAVTMATEHVGACWQVQSLLLDCALGVQRYFILMGASRYYPGFYTGPTAGSPSEKGMALAAVSSFMGNMKECSLIPMESSSSTGSLVTTTDGRRVAALFSDVPVTRCFKVKENVLYKGMDFIGNPLEFKSQGTVLPVSFGMEPVYIFDVPQDFAELPVLSIKEFSALVSPNSKVSGTIKISNLFPSRLDGTLSLSSPGSKAVFENKISIDPGTISEVPFTLEAGPIKRGNHELKASLISGGKEIALSEKEFSSEGVARPVPMIAKEIKLDADPSEWETISAEVADSPSNVVIGKPPVGYYEKNSWQGPKDLSFSVKTAWRRDDGVYFLLDIVDDKIKTVTPDKVGMSFLQDGLEFFFDGRQLKDQTPVYSFGTEQVLVLPSVEDSVKQCLFKNCSKFGESIELELVGKRTVSGYIIEGRIRPKKDSPFKLAAGVRFGMDFVFDDAADAEMTRRTQMALHGTASNNFDTSNFGRYQLVEASSIDGRILLDTRSKNDDTASTWKFSKHCLEKMPPEEAAKIKWELKDESDSKVFHVGVDSSLQAGMWWEKSISVIGGTSLSISLQVKARISGSSQYAYADASVFFLDGKGSWIGHESIGSQPVFDDPQWGTLSKDFMVPSNACIMGVRLGCASSGIKGSTDFQFKDIVIKEQL
ncbi:MAG: LamG-like jellyroll fold domain-containing protein [Victivallales bacterium]